MYNPLFRQHSACHQTSDKDSRLTSHFAVCWRGLLTWLWVGLLGMSVSCAPARGTLQPVSTGNGAQTQALPLSGAPSKATPRLTTGANPPPGGLLNTYIIGPEDVLEISVWKNADLSQEETVRADGQVALKLIGEIPAAGMNIASLRQLITEKYRDFVPEAEVKVSLKEMNSFKIYVLGRVSKPGEYRVKSQLTALQALALAGGFTPYANERAVKILRRKGDVDVLYPFNYRDVLKGRAADMPLEPGDRLMVP